MRGERNRAERRRPGASQSTRHGIVLSHEVKAITYHGLRVEHEVGGWVAEVIVDI